MRFMRPGTAQHSQAGEVASLRPAAVARTFSVAVEQCGERACRAQRAKRAVWNETSLEVAYRDEVVDALVLTKDVGKLRGCRTGREERESDILGWKEWRVD